MSAWLVVALFLCPDGAVIDRVEGTSLVVMGASGVRVIAAQSVSSPRRRGVREGDRVFSTANGGCRAAAPSRADVGRVRERLRELIRAGNRTPPAGTARFPR